MPRRMPYSTSYLRRSLRQMDWITLMFGATAEDT